MGRSDCTGFWRAAGQLLSWRTAPACLLMALSVEAVARLCPVILPKTVHQPFLYSVRESERSKGEQMRGELITWIGNGRGARGDLYHGQSIQLAVLGSSTTACSQLSQEDAWPEQMRARLPGVHVDNFARDGAFQNETVRVLRHLTQIGREYDVVLLMMDISELGQRDTERKAFRHWGQWAPKEGWVQADWLLKQEVEKQIRKEPRLRRPLRKLGLLGPTVRQQHWMRHRRERVLRATERIQLVDEVAVFGQERLRFIDEETRRLLAAAQELGERVYLISQPMAYAEDEHPDVAKQWARLYPVLRGKKEAYRSNKSKADEVRHKNRLMAEIALEVGVEVIDLDAQIRPLLRDRADLFYDRWHFLPAGSRIAGKFVAEVLREDLSPPATER